MKSSAQHVQEVCAGKVRYSTRSLAREAIRGITTQPKRSRRKKNFHSYHCPACGDYHIASP